MKPLHSFVVTSYLPKQINALKELSYNYWWCWDSDAKELFKRMDDKLWEEVAHNPVLMINKLPQGKLRELASQPDFVSFLNYVYSKYQKYMQAETWYDSQKKDKDKLIAYFSPEFGINESFPNYSGGLGILSGDHLKSASDLGLPLVGLGLLYQQGYFHQHLTQNGWQNEEYKTNDFFTLPLTLVRDEAGEPVIIDMNFPNGKVYIQIWKMNIGRIDLFLLDTNIDLNQNEEYRDITDQLYGGSRDTRIQQELVLGIGGMRALRAMNMLPDVVHINEGHAAFALLERTKQFMEDYKLDFRSAKQIVRASSIFTTHTPVPAGNEEFVQERVDAYFKNYYAKLNLTKEQFFSFGQEGSDYNEHEKFSMTVLGLKMTSYHNGVSKLHGEVAREMWHRIWKCFPSHEVPIKHITNGIHTMTWLAGEFKDLYDRYLSPNWQRDIDNEDIWENVDSIPTEEVYREKQRRRVSLVLFVRKYLKQQHNHFLSPDQMRQIDEYLDPDALTIGFARRFATYKRANLIFKDMERLAAICKNEERPVQLIISGKAHPKDNAGKEMIQNIIHNIKQYNLEKHIVFLEDYDMVIGRVMVKGCDVWLNNPVKPLEASGTSGMKAALNGTINFSVLDGWWAEAYNGNNGFAIGEGQSYDNYEEQEYLEAQAIYEMLEQTIIPMFYDRSDSRVPNKWVDYMKESIKTIAPTYSTARMVKEYAERYYLQVLDRIDMMRERKGANAKEFNKWKEKIRRNWKNIDIIDVNYQQSEEIYLGKPIKVSAIVELDGLEPDDVDVQIYYGSVDSHGELKAIASQPMKLKKCQDEYCYYEGEYTCPDTGMQGFTIRVLPKNSMLVDPTEMYLCRWADEQE